MTGKGNEIGNSGIRVIPETFLNWWSKNKLISSLYRKALRGLSLDFAFSFKDWLPGFKCAPEQAPEIHQIPAGVPGTGVLPELLCLLPATLHISTGHCGFLAVRAVVPAQIFCISANFDERFFLTSIYPDSYSAHMSELIYSHLQWGRNAI